MKMLFATTFTMTLLFPGVGSDERKPDKVIEIAAPNGKPSFTEMGKDKPEGVTTVVGQTVRWVNRDSSPHRVVSSLEVDGKPVIDTGVIEPGKYRDVILDNDLYRRAGGKTAGVIVITYCSQGHPNPLAKLQILSPARR